MLSKKESDYPTITGNEYWIKKMRTLYRRLDASGSGSINMDDFLEISSTMLSENAKMDTGKGDEIVKCSIDLWYNYLVCHLENSQRPSATIGESQFVANMKLALNGGLKADFLDHFVKPFFTAVDDDDDGKITQRQFQQMMVAWKAPATNADMSFKFMDVKRANKLTLEECQMGLAEFFFCEDTKSKMGQLWGKLVSYKRPEDYPEIQCNNTWEGKMRTMFRRLDVDGTGYLKCENFIKIGRSLASRGHLDKKKTHNVLKAMLNIWVKFISVNKNGKHLDSVGEKEFIHNLRDMINTPFRRELDQVGWAFFKAVEVDGNGSISLQEYRNLQESWKVSREEADGMFKVIDTDKDGNVTFDEYLNAFTDYFFSEDSKSVYSGFFGPVVVKHMDHR